MKKSYPLFIILTLFTFQFCFSQENTITKDTIGLNEVIIKKESNRKQIIAIIKKIKNNLRNNYDLNSHNYTTEHFSIKDHKDTLVNRKMINNLDLKILSQSNLESILLNSSKNPFHTNTSPYFRFEPSATNDNYWLALSIFYDSLHVLDFDFFDTSRSYKYQISKEENITTVTFTANRYYSGYFSFNNTNYNLIRIAFKNTQPYSYYINAYEGKKNNNVFESQWKYNRVTILLDFTTTPEGKLLLAKLNAMQELTQFQFKRYLLDPKRIVDQDKNIKFYTTLNMRILE
jgi:hypothetical protein